MSLRPGATLATTTTTHAGMETTVSRRFVLTKKITLTITTQGSPRAKKESNKTGPDSEPPKHALELKWHPQQHQNMDLKS